ncbi:hypothetical protein B0681_04875 [Moraxella porci DSM 25326]|uniref:Uncharacterized protein n=1 Tax=Moraxella porci DSM 25326 TaxID=573983 RepID=A0A1T0CSP1_9GAMM|nr:hypothetical protein [Moraxella porci]OOS25356.1 hypothetical protein B0681_04875 [Moraxella porci DSM 25326]
MVNNFIIAHLYEIEEELNIFEDNFDERLLESFKNIEKQAKESRLGYLQKRNSAFCPDCDDEATIEENAFFHQVNFVNLHEDFKNDFINISAVWLYHIFERRFKQVFNCRNDNYRMNDILSKFNLVSSNYEFEKCTNICTINYELRLVANAIKHGKGRSFDQLVRKYPNMVVDNKLISLADAKIQVGEDDIHRYILAMRAFWRQVLESSYG